MRTVRRLLQKCERTLLFATLYRQFFGYDAWSMSSQAPIEIKAKEKATATVIFLHGLGDTGHGWSAGFADILPSHVKGLFPNAPIQPVTLNAGMSMPSWFDIRSLRFDGPEDTEGIEKSSRLLMSLVEQEEKNGIPLNRIVIGGFSQGGAVALHAALTSGKAFGGVLALSTWLPLHKELVKCPPVESLNILQCHGKADPVVNFAYGDMTAKLLKSRYPNFTFNTYQNMGHSSSPEEMAEVKVFLTKIVPKV